MLNTHTTFFSFRKTQKTKGDMQKAAPRQVAALLTQTKPSTLFLTSLSTQLAVNNSSGLSLFGASEIYLTNIAPGQWIHWRNSIEIRYFFIRILWGSQSKLVWKYDYGRALGVYDVWATLHIHIYTHLYVVMALASNNFLDSSNRPRITND